MFRREAEVRATFVTAKHTATCTTRPAGGVKCVCGHVWCRVYLVSFTARLSSALILTDLGSR